MSSLKEYIRHFHDLGHDTFFESPSEHVLDAYTFSEANTNIKPQFSEGSVKAPQPKHTDSPSRKIAEKATTLAELKEILQSFDGCDLKKMAKSTVFADGNPNSPIMFIGEAPGANEDEQGIPFCGQSGKLLNNIILSIGIQRDEAYITNTVFWRPPGNRRPSAEEINICRPFVEKQIAFIKPKVIVLVGSTAVESLLSSDISMHDLRNTNYMYSNQYLDQPILTLVIFHPSYLLRQPSKKKLMWQDMLKIKGLLG